MFSTIMQLLGGSLIGVALSFAFAYVFGSPYTMVEQAKRGALAFLLLAAICTAIAYALKNTFVAVCLLAILGFVCNHWLPKANKVKG